MGLVFHPGKADTKQLIIYVIAPVMNAVWEHMSEVLA